MKRIKNVWPLYLLPVGLFFAFFFFYPVVESVIVSLHPEGSKDYSFANYKEFFTNPQMFRVLKFTAIDLGIIVTLLSLVIAIILAYKLRKTFRGVTIFRTIITFPLAYSGLIASSIVYLAFSGSGLFNIVLMKVGAINRPLPMMGNYTGVVIASIYQQVPILFLFIISAMGGINPSLEEAAASLGATRWQIFKRIIFPLILPAILTAGILGYVSNYGCYVTALITGDPAYRTRTVMIEAYEQAYIKFNYPMATTVTVISAIVALIFMYFYLRLQRRLTASAGKN